MKNKIYIPEKRKIGSTEDKWTKTQVIQGDAE